MLICVLDYRDAFGALDVQAALDDADDGDRVYFPGTQVYISPATGPWVIRKNIEVFGDGPSNPAVTPGTTILAGGTADVFVIEPPDPAPSRIENVYVHGFQIKAGPGAGSSGIHVKTASNKGVGTVELERVRVFNLDQHAFFFEGTNDTTGAIERLIMTACGTFNCKELGFLLQYVRHATLVRSNANTCKVGGVVAQNSGCVLYRSSLENNGVDAQGAPGPGTHPQLWFNTCHLATVDAAHFENFHHAPKKACIMEQSGGAAWLAASSFSIPGIPPPDPPFDNTNTVGLEVPAATTAGPVLAGCNHFERVDKLLDIAEGTAGAVVLPQFVDREGAVKTGQIVIPPTTDSGNNVLLSSPTISRKGTPLREFAGLIIPALAADPLFAVQDGMICYDASQHRFRVRIADDWKTVRTN